MMHSVLENKNSSIGGSSVPKTLGKKQVYPYFLLSDKRGNGLTFQVYVDSVTGWWQALRSQ